VSFGNACIELTDLETENIGAKISIYEGITTKNRIGR